MTFTVTTEDPEEARRLAKCTDMAIALFDIRQALRDNDEPQTRDELAEKIGYIIADHNIIIDDILT
ncbi:MAG: hypothetical protein Q8L89_04335 [Gammaproteobacteria bacterium]|nr:hypothetical protein [Gammaproteobacteria bacterium]